MIVYSCGCTSKKAAITASCVTHNCPPVTEYSSLVKIADKRVFRKGKFLIVYDSMISGMRRIKTGKVGLILTYPYINSFYARDAVQLSKFTDMPDTYFPECFRLLQDEGHVVLFVDSYVLHSVLYCAFMAGFKLNSISVCPFLLKDIPESAKFINELYYYKNCVVLSKKGNTTLDNFKLTGNSITKLIEKFKPEGIILDTSCIHYPILTNNTSGVKTIGVVSSKDRFDNIVRKLDR